MGSDLLHSNAGSKMALIWRNLGILFFLYSLPVESFFSYEHCGGDNSIIHLKTLSITPDPFNLKEPLVNVSAEASVTRDVPDSAKLHARLYMIKQFLGMDLPALLIPCFGGIYGSCSFPLCEYMDMMKFGKCPFPQESDCACPPKKGNYVVNNIPVDLTGILHLAKKMVSKGKYRLEMIMFDEDTGEQLACLKFFAEIK